MEGKDRRSLSRYWQIVIELGLQRILIEKQFAFEQITVSSDAFQDMSPFGDDCRIESRNPRTYAQNS